MDQRVSGSANVAATWSAGAPVRSGPDDLRRAWAITAILAALSTFSFLDRQILALLVPNLKQSLGITDVQFGILTGPAFIVVYNAALLLAALVVDRWNRVRLIWIGAALWTIMTMLSGLAQNYEQLLLFRGGLALGEALLGPAAISLIGDLFAREDRPLPTATYIAGSVIGTTGSTILSAMFLQAAGWLNPIIGLFSAGEAWRLTLVGVGLPGFLLAIALFAIGREPPRPAKPEASDPGQSVALGHLRGHWPLYACIFVAFGALNMLSTALAIWGPTHLIRFYGLTQVRAGYTLGVASLALGVAGTLTLPAVFRRLIRRGDVRALLNLAIGAVLAAVVAGVVGGATRSLPLCVACFGLVMFFTMGVGTLPTLIIQLYAPADLRGRISASLFFTLYLLAIGITPVIIPLMANGMFEGENVLGKAIAAVTLIFGSISALLFAAARRPMLRAEAAVSASVAR